jgi:hypothetical protein
MIPKPALTPADRRRRDLRRVRTGLVSFAALALYAGLLWPIRNSVTDDTYIHLVFAKHFRDGLGLVFNPGQPVFGTTSPLWSLGLGVLGKSGIDLLLLARGLSMLFGAAAIVAFAMFLRRFLESWVSEQGYGAGRGELAWAMGTLAFAGDVWLVRWSATGMETALAVFLVTAGFAAYVMLRPWGNRVLLPAAWWSLASLARPEAAVLLVLLVLRVVISGSPRHVKLERLGWVLLPIVLVQGAWLAYACSLYGTVVPATLAAKAAGGLGPHVFLDLIVRQGRAIIAARGIELLVLVAFAPALVTRFWVRRADHFVPLGWLLGLPLLYALRGVPAISRYLVPLLPLIVAYAWGTLAWLAAGYRRNPALAVAGLALAGVLSLANSLYTYTRFVVPQADAFSQDVGGSLRELGEWCNVHTPAGTEIAMPDIGAFGYFADRPVIDLAGLVTPAITPLLARYGYDDLVVNLRFAEVVRPPYMIDRADMPRRMLFQSPYATCLEVVMVRRVDQRGIQHPEPAYYTLYRVDWVAFDRMAGGERHASIFRTRPYRVATLGPRHSAQTGPRVRRAPAAPPNPAELAPCRGPSVAYTLWAGAEDRVVFAAGSSSAAQSKRPGFWMRWGAPDGRGNLVDTKAGTFTYDRVSDRDTTVAMRWSSAQLDTMRRAAVALRILELPEPCPEMKPMADGTAVSVHPDLWVFMELELDGVQRRFGWSGTTRANGTAVHPEQWDRLDQFTHLLDATVKRHPAYRALPPVRGGYE